MCVLTGGKHLDQKASEHNRSLEVRFGRCTIYGLHIPRLRFGTFKGILISLVGNTPPGTDDYQALAKSIQGEYQRILGDLPDGALKSDQPSQRVNSIPASST